MTSQKALDALHEIWVNAEAGRMDQLAREGYRAAAADSGIQIFCPSHRVNHVLDAHRVEELIYALVGWMSDAVSSPEDWDFEGERPTSDSWLAEFCPVDTLRTLDDGEMYHEHIESWVEARQHWMAQGEVTEP